MGLELYGMPAKFYGGQILRIDISSNMSEMSEGAFQVFAQCILLSSGDSFHLISFRKKIWYWWLNGDFPWGLDNSAQQTNFFVKRYCNAMILNTVLTAYRFRIVGHVKPSSHSFLVFLSSSFIFSVFKIKIWIVFCVLSFISCPPLESQLRESFVGNGDEDWPWLRRSDHSLKCKWLGGYIYLLSLISLR